MNSIKCPQCGLVNWGTPPACKRCNASFEGISEQSFVSVPAGEHPFAPHSTEDTEQTRKVWKWFVVYCVLMALLYLFVTLLGAGMLIISAVAPPSNQERGELLVQGIAFLILGLIFTVPYAMGPFIKGKSWGWVFGVILIAIGLTSCCLWPITIPLIIQWTKPEIKRMFGPS
jgi:hypothetical protein